MRSDGAVRPTRHRQNAFMELAIAFEGGVLGGLVVGDMHVARKGNPHWIVGTSARRALGLEYSNALADDVERCELVEEQIVAALGHAANGRGGPGGHPERRVRFLAGRRLDQDVVEGPEAAVVREALPRSPCFDDDRKRLLEARIGLVEWDREARELIVAITFADSEIEPALRQEVQGRGLLGQEHWIVPRQHHYGSAEPQRRGARREPRQQGEGGRDLVPAGEVVLNQERAVVAKRFRFDVEIDEVMKALAHRRAGTRAAGLRRTKNSKPHDHSPYSRRAPVLASNAGDSASMSALSKNIRGRATEPHCSMRTIL